MTHEFSWKACHIHASSRLSREYGLSSNLVQTWSFYDIVSMQVRMVLEQCDPKESINEG